MVDTCDTYTYDQIPVKIQKIYEYTDTKIGEILANNIVNNLSIYHIDDINKITKEKIEKDFEDLINKNISADKLLFYLVASEQNMDGLYCEFIDNGWQYVNNCYQICMNKYDLYSDISIISPYKLKNIKIIKNNFIQYPLDVATETPVNNLFVYRFNKFILSNL